VLPAGAAARRLLPGWLSSEPAATAVDPPSRTLKIVTRETCASTALFEHGCGDSGAWAAPPTRRATGAHSDPEDRHARKGRARFTVRGHRAERHPA
jgi:hypothetical protein